MSFDEELTNTFARHCRRRPRIAGGMNQIELTELQMNCLGCALADPREASTQHLLSRTGASTVDGVLAAIFVARDSERSVLLALARQVIEKHRPNCQDPEKCLL